MKHLFLAFLIFSNYSAFTQYKTLNNNESVEIIKNGIKLHEDKKYDEAITEFKKIDRNDSSYYLAQIELINTYQASKHDSLALIICDDIIANYDKYKATTLLFKANCLDNLNRFDEAVAGYKKGNEVYPRNYGFYFELGLAYFRKEKYQEAYYYFTKTIKLNPFYSPAHLQMANLALKQQKFLSAILAYEFFLVNENRTKRAQNIIVYIESILKGETEQKEKITIPGITELDDFSELESLVKSKIAITKQYKSKIDLNYELTKQMQLISEKISYNKSDTGFYMQFYAPFFEELQKKNFFEPFAYNVLSGMDLPEINKWLEKNKSLSEKYSNWAYNFIKDKHCIYSDEINGEKGIFTHYFSGNHLIAMAAQNENPSNKNNIWYYFHDNGNLKSYGNYKNNVQTGEWHYYYPNGKLKEISKKENEKVNGKMQEYSDNGIQKSDLFYSNGMLEGEQKIFFENGNLKGTYTFKNDKREGKEVAYFYNDVMKYEVTNLNQKYQGLYQEYYSSGNLNQVITFDNGDKTGKYYSYFNDKEKILETEGQYAKNNPVGEWKFYNRKKQLIKTGNYNNEGEYIGTWKYFYDNGNIKIEESYSDNGKLNGVYKYYAENGKNTEEFIYKNGVLTDYKQFDDKGKLLAEGNREKKKIDVKMFYPNGNIKKQGLLENNKASNEWQFYNYDGVLTSKYNYLEGNYNGMSTEYYANGTKKSELNYKDNLSDGCYTLYYKDGKIHTDGSYINDQRQGYWREFNPNQVLTALTYYKDGELSGEQIYYSETGVLERKEYIDNNELKYKILYYDTLGNHSTTYNYKLGENNIVVKLHNGNTRLKYTMINGVITGPLFRYFPNEKVEEQINYTKGLRNGEATMYDIFGNLIEKSFYVNDQLHGVNEEYYPNGKIKKTSNYELGELNGKMKIYHENGKLQRELDYVDGLISGTSTNYDEEGQLVAKRIFFEDALVSYQYNDKTGKLTDPIYTVNGNIKVKCFFQNGKPSLTYELKNGELEGNRKEYHSNGNISNEENFSCGENIGEENFYYPSGKIKTTITYKNGVKNGPYLVYYENGKTKQHSQYKANKQFGEAKLYAEDGKLTKTLVFFDDIVESEK